MDDLGEADPIIEFLSFRGELEGINWSDPPPKGRRAEMLAGGTGRSHRAPCLERDEDKCSWDDVDEGPPETDESWEVRAHPKLVAPPRMPPPLPPPHHPTRSRPAGVRLE